ncbi:MAG: EscU/YscU/HrcU family type III secretion system export apparatus switch protein [Spirochaetaceae bacterium]|nr:EscU/YscU/HrcU family type III secretion system export apparatus switch protein [Spirochaetaceae bacterium]
MKRRDQRSAAALSYRAEEGVPRVLASGRGGEAERILAAARKAGVTIVEDAPLAALLGASARPGDPVPRKCWEAVAEILAFVFRQEEGRVKGERRREN